MGPKITSAMVCLLVARAPVPILGFAASFSPPPDSIAIATPHSSLGMASKPRHAAEDTCCGPLDDALAAHDAPPRLACLAITALCTIAVTSARHPAAAVDASAGCVEPFTAPEMWWAIRDGYIGDLMSHLCRNGGLVMSDTAGIVGPSPSPLELGEAMFSNGVGGGMSIPFTPEEVLFAIQHGYSYDMVAHWFRYSGLVV